MTELVTIDNIIDRYYVKYRNEYEPYSLIQHIHKHIKLIFTHYNFPVSYIKDRLFKLLSYQEQLERLLKLPKVEQRSQEWYAMRQNIITASDFAQALGDGKFGTQKQFFQKKCGYEKDTFDNNNPALKWGVKYEPVAIDAYAYKNNMKMYEFGLLKHPHLHWFGASPDSISELGIMVEIKCPYRRKITGEIPKQYYYQIQGQLDVCSLKECDYLECEFLEYDSAEEFEQHFKDNENERGIIIEYIDSDNQTQYEYSPFKYNNQLKQLLEWKEEILQSLKQSVRKVYYWQLHTYSVVRVYKNDEFLTEKFSLLKSVFDKIIQYKSDKMKYDTDISSNTRTFDMTDVNIENVNDPINTSKKKKADVQLNGWAFLSDNEEDS
jgi:putative phage-type endonuclease